MASWESKSWPLRRWLADRLIGDHAYKRNVSEPPAGMTWMTETWTYNDQRYRGGRLPFAVARPYDQDANTRSPQETA